jgi:hypothetical protein
MGARRSRRFVTVPAPGKVLPAAGGMADGSAGAAAALLARNTPWPFSVRQQVALAGAQASLEPAPGA